MLYVLANQSSAAKRRVYFQLVSVSDGITPATSEAGGQPQISTDGDAWTSTGIGTLGAIGYGRYFADLTQAAVSSAGIKIETRYRSAATAECPGDSVRVVGVDLDNATSLGLTRVDAAITSRLAGAGVGSGTLTVSTVEYGSLSPISAVVVSLLDPQTGTIVASGTSNGSGILVLNHSGGLLNVQAARNGWTFAVAPVSLTLGQVAGVNVYGAIGAAVTPAVDPELCTVYLTIRLASGNPATGTVGSARIESLPSTVNGSFYSGQTLSATASAQGVMSWSVPRGARMVVDIPGVVPECTVVVPDSSSAELSSLIG